MLATAALLLAAALQSDREIAIRLRDSDITLVLPEKPLPLPRDTIVAWVRAAGDTVADYFGKFPVPKVRLELRAADTGALQSGKTWAGRLVRITLGPATREQDLRDDWMLTHEFCHLAFPDLDEKYAWLYEGYATYLEPIARVRSGRLPVERLWKETLEGMPKGLPGPTGGGLDGTTSWGRTYWGGALFWLTADLDLRDRTQGKASLQTALRGILNAGDDGTTTWDVEELLQKGDAATGTRVLHELYERMGKVAYTADLPALWKRLGVERRGGDVRLDDQAPWSALRRSLTEH